MLTPNQLCKSGTEHGHQVALFAWCAVAKRHGFKDADLWCETGKMPSGLSGFYAACYGGDFPDLVPELEWLYAVHNQGHGDKTRGGIAKAEGVKAGVSDLCWPLYRQQPVQTRTEAPEFYCGLYIEMKKPSVKPVKQSSKGGASNEQIAFGEFVKAQHYHFVVCYSWREAADVIEQYYFGKI